MAARDRYSRKLECSKCGHQGFAEASESDDKSRRDVDFRIDEMPRGFRAERVSGDPTDFMIRCASAAIYSVSCRKPPMRPEASRA